MPHERWTNWDSLVVAAVVFGGGAICLGIAALVECCYYGG